MSNNPHNIERIVWVQAFCKWHKPVFKVGTLICDNMKCINCKISEKCTEPVELKHEDIKLLKEIMPEYFI